MNIDVILLNSEAMGYNNLTQLLFKIRISAVKNPNFRRQRLTESGTTINGRISSWSDSQRLLLAATLRASKDEPLLGLVSIAAMLILNSFNFKPVWIKGDLQKNNFFLGCKRVNIEAWLKISPFSSFA